jgi:hypothetical protein
MSHKCFFISLWFDGMPVLVSLNFVCMVNAVVYMYCNPQTEQFVCLGPVTSQHVYEHLLFCCPQEPFEGEEGHDTVDWVMGDSYTRQETVHPQG